MDSNDDEFGPVAETVLSTLKSSGVNVHATLTWNTIYHHGYMKNPFDELVENTYMDTRSKYSAHHSHMYSVKNIYSV